MAAVVTALGLSGADLDEIRRAFDLFDANKDGHITATEIKNAMTQIGLNPSGGEIQQIINQADKDNSGTIEWEEFKQAMSASKTRLRLSEPQYMEAFKIFDVDGDGQITRKELESVVNKLGINYIYSADVISKIFETADTNRDGKINQQEFLTAMKRGI